MVADWISQPNENKADTVSGANNAQAHDHPRCNQPENLPVPPVSQIRKTTNVASTTNKDVIVTRSI